MALDFWGDRPHGRMIARISSTESVTICSGESALGKQGRRHLIHALIGTLRAQQYRDQQRVRVAVIEGHRVFVDRAPAVSDR